MNTKLNLLMKEQGITGRKLHELTGIGLGDISKMRNGLLKPTQIQQIKIAFALNHEENPEELFDVVTYEQLIGGK